MRRHVERESPQKARRSRDQGSYNEHCRTGSPRRSHGEGYRSSRYSRSRQRSPDTKSRDPKRRDRAQTPEEFRTLCVRKYSSKLSIEAIQEYLFREFNKFGDMSISVGHLDGERAALITFKYPEDAREAFCQKPTVYLHDRSVVVEALPDNITEDDSGKPTARSGGSGHQSDAEELDEAMEQRPSPHLMPNSKIEASFAGLLAKSNSMGSTGPASLLGVPGMAPSAMMAAAARALGLGAPTALVPPIPAHLGGGSRGRLGIPGSRRFDQCHSAYSPPSSDPEQYSKATRTLFVGSLECDITEAEVLDAFERYGCVEQIDIKRSPKPGAHSYAFVRYENVDMACRAKMTMSGRCVRALHCKIGYGKPIPSKCLYVSGLGPWITAEAFIRFLSRFGPVTQLDWPNGRSYAQIMFETCDSACAAHNQLKGLPISSRTNRKLRVDFVDPEVFRPGRTKFAGSLGGTLESSLTADLQSGFRNPNATFLAEPSYNELTVEKDITNRTHQTHSKEQFDTMSRYTIRQGLCDEKQGRVGWQPGRQSYRFSASSDRHHLGSRTVHRFTDAQGLLSPVESTLPTLQSVVSLSELDYCLQPDLWRGEILLKKNTFHFRCLHLIGDAEVGCLLGRSSNVTPETDDALNPTLRVVGRASLDPAWMAEATHRIHSVLSSHCRGLCLMLVLPDHSASERVKSNQKAEQTDTMTVNESEDKSGAHYPLQVLVAYFKLKQAVGVIVPVKLHSKEVEEKDEEKQKAFNEALTVHLFAPSSFALSLLKQAAPKLSSDLATMQDYMVLLAIRR
ncbi:unnamed protein product [Calicophoron daubneyi]|uniref:RNA-binding protein 15 n=1 Tax=Calicophoron daubneyi TaxID=300641 RepID=A0AAV2TEU9_CALDB